MSTPNQHASAQWERAAKVGILDTLRDGSPCVNFGDGQILWRRAEGYSFCGNAPMGEELVTYGASPVEAVTKALRIARSEADAGDGGSEGGDEYDAQLSAIWERVADEVEILLGYIT